MRTIKFYKIILLFLSLLLVSLIYTVNYNREWKQIRKQNVASKLNETDNFIKPIVIIPNLTKKPEYCLTCHQGIGEISKSHPTEVFGCVTCHGGQPLSLDKNVAHAGLRGGKNPSALNVVEESCSRAPNGESCHNGFSHKADRWKNMLDRVKASLQSTCAGAIATVRFSYGFQKMSQPQYGTIAVIDTIGGIHEHAQRIEKYESYIEQESKANRLSAIEKKYFDNCITAGCHLNTDAPRKTYFYRSTGCAACHVLYADDGKYVGNDLTISREESGHMQKHEFTTAIPFTQCNHCHNRGTYSMKHMTFRDRSDVEPDSLKFLSRKELRKKRYYIPLAQYAKCEVSLDCIDCHTHNEIMGDGHIYPNKKKSVEVHCSTCHGTINSLPLEHVARDLGEKDLFIAGLNPFFSISAGDTVLTSESGTIFPFVKKINGRWFQISKVNGQNLLLPVVFGSKCKQTGEEENSSACHKCHDISKEKSY